MRILRSNDKTLYIIGLRMGEPLIIFEFLHPPLAVKCVITDAYTVASFHLLIAILRRRKAASRQRKVARVEERTSPLEQRLVRVWK